MKKKSFSIILILLGISLNSCSPTLMTNLLTVDNGRNYTRKTSSSQVKGRSNTGRVNSSQVKSKEKSNDERENRNISKTSGNVVLTCLGEGSSLSEATSNALRSGIEQTYGAFVSSNTTLLNDNMVKDEVISVSSGNIVAYKIMSQSNIDGRYQVTVQAEISQSKLTTFAKSKGARTEINTSALAMNVKLAQFYKKNEEKAFKHLSAVLKEMAPFCIDYIIKTTDPIKIERGEDHGSWVVNTWVGYKYNENFKAAEDMILQTVKSLSMTQSEAEQYKSLGEDVYKTYYKGNVFLLRTKAIDWNDKWTFSDPYKIRIDNIVKEIVKENFILYENGIDVTQSLPQGKIYGAGSYIKNEYWENGRHFSDRDEYATCYYRSDIIDGRPKDKRFSFPIKKGEHWIHVYEKQLTLKELESFNANYEIRSKHQKK